MDRAETSADDAYLPDPATQTGMRRRMIDWFWRTRAAAHRTAPGRMIWKGVVAFLGLLVVVIGIIMLPLPGPGWLVIFAGIGIWATEFDWAKRLLRWTKAEVRILLTWWTNLSKAIQGLFIAAGLGCVLAVVWAYFEYRDRLPII